MKSRYFSYVEIDKSILNAFIAKHPKLGNFINTDNPFYVRIYKKPYIGLIHSIISQDENNEEVIKKWNGLTQASRRIKAKQIHELGLESLVSILDHDKANIIFNISNDVLSGILDLEKLAKQSDEEIIKTLSHYQGLTINTIKTFIIFSCFHQDVICDTDQDFLQGLQVFLNKQNVDQQDINNIKIEYKGQLTLFSLCMWKIRNERAK